MDDTDKAPSNRRYNGESDAESTSAKSAGSSFSRLFRRKNNRKNRHKERQIAASEVRSMGDSTAGDSYGSFAKMSRRWKNRNFDQESLLSDDCASSDDAPRNSSTRNHRQRGSSTSSLIQSRSVSSLTGHQEQAVQSVPAKKKSKKKRFSFHRRRHSRENASVVSSPSKLQYDAKSEAGTEYSSSPKSMSPTRKKALHNSSPQSISASANEAPSPMRTKQDDDPVIQLFEDRATQRVRFALEGGADEIPTRDSSADETNSITNGRPFGLKRFVKGALFGQDDKKEVDDEVERELETVKHEMVWESTETATGGEMIVTDQDSRKNMATAFQEDPKTRKEVIKLLNKARRAQHTHFQYEYAVKCYMKALDILKNAKYPKDHPVALRTFQALDHAHHAVSSYKNSANIVKMGIRYEDNKELVRALKMYTIAYRIRVDNLGRRHPSLLVLLNMLGNIQIKRGELQEAMQIYELALRDDSVIDDFQDSDDDSSDSPSKDSPPSRNLLARSTAFRDMGVIFDKWGEYEQALAMYHKSLDSLAEYKQIGMSSIGANASFNTSFPEDGSSPNIEFDQSKHPTTATASATGGDDGMEILVGRHSEDDDKRKKSYIFQASSDYDVFFPPQLDVEMRARQKSGIGDKAPKGDFADIDAAMTLHQIGQLHRSKGEYNLSLSAFSVALRGMKYCVGRNHPNVAAILGNIGNLQKEMGDMDASFATYQQVLGIETYRLGLSHPDVAGKI